MAAPRRWRLDGRRWLRRKIADGEELAAGGPDHHRQIYCRRYQTATVRRFEGACTGQGRAQAIKAGGIGINFEDQVVGGSGLYPADRQAARIAAIRAMADARAHAPGRPTVP